MGRKSADCRVRTFDKSEPAHIQDLWHPGSPRASAQWKTDGLCIYCGDPVPNTQNTWTPVGLLCIRCRLDLGHKHDDWRQRATKRAARVFKQFGIPIDGGTP